MSQSYLMMILWIFMFNSMFSLIFYNNLSMIEMILNLISMTICTCMIMTNFSSFSFYSFIVFLMIIGGLIILFMMFLSLISNQYINYNMKKMIKVLLYSSTLFYFFKFMPLNNIYINYLNWLIYYSSSFINSNYMLNMMNTNQIYNYPINIIFILLIFFLLLMLILITKICLKNNKPLRSTKKS